MQGISVGNGTFQLQRLTFTLEQISRSTSHSPGLGTFCIFMNGLFCISPAKFPILPASKVAARLLRILLAGPSRVYCYSTNRSSVVLQVIEIQWPSSLAMQSHGFLWICIELEKKEGEEEEQNKKINATFCCLPATVAQWQILGAMQ